MFDGEHLMDKSQCQHRTRVLSCKNTIRKKSELFPKTSGFNKMDESRITTRQHLINSDLFSQPPG